MTRNRLQWLLVGLIYVLLALDAAARVYYLYWTYPWFDRLTHTVGGIWIGLAVLWFVYFSGMITPRQWSPRHGLLLTLLGAVLLGVVWEIYEVVVHIAAQLPFENGYMLDATADLCMDIAGACAAFLLFAYAMRKTPTTMLSNSGAQLNETPTSGVTP